MVRLLGLVLCAVVLLVARSWASGETSIIALAKTDSVTVKIVDPGAYRAGSGLSYKISHWPEGQVLSQGQVASKNVTADEIGLPTFKLTGLRPRLWSPQDPQLYEIEVRGSAGALLGRARFGFRTFEARSGSFYLNGRPIFLRGFPINPPGRDLPEKTGTDPEFIRGYLKLLKSGGVNMVRVESDAWQSVCDELGLMTFQGRYGPSPGGGSHNPPTFERCRDEYRRLFIELANHPSVVIYVLTNEVDYTTTKYLDLLTRVREDIRQLDPTRPVIGNAGFGGGKPGEVYDVHCYYGWYAHNFHDWYRVYADYLDRAGKAGQPLTVTECVGSYTSDAGLFLTMSKQMCTMMRWIGASEDPRQASLEHQAELVRQVVEIGRRMRTSKSGVAGIMPFTYFLGWATAKQASDLIVKPAFEVLRTVFQPVLVSPECWRRDIYAGDELRVRLCVVNDDDQCRDMANAQALVEVRDANGKAVASGKAEFPSVPYYSNAWADVAIPIPRDLPRGRYIVNSQLTENGREISTNSFEITVAPRDWPRLGGAAVKVYDPVGATTKALESFGAKVEGLPDLARLPDGGVLVIGEKAFSNGPYPAKADVLAFPERGGRILCLEHDQAAWRGDWLPASFALSAARTSFTYIQPVGRNGVIFDSLDARDLRYWNDLGRNAGGVPDVYPVTVPFRAAAVDDLRSCRVWASCDQLLSGAVILEVFHGGGSVILSQFRCAERVKDDPVAAKLLGNLVRYALAPRRLGLIDLSEPVRWDMEAFRGGVFVSNLQGLLPHSKTYRHTGSSKGRLGEDHAIDGITLVGDYHFTVNGWIEPVPDPTRLRHRGYGKQVTNARERCAMSPPDSQGRGSNQHRVGRAPVQDMLCAKTGASGAWA